MPSLKDLEMAAAVSAYRNIDIKNSPVFNARFYEGKDVEMIAKLF
jgi:hypothetical protein